MAVKIYNKSRELVADIAAAFGISYELRANAIARASFSIPLDEWHADDISGLYYAEIYDNDERLELFRIMRTSESRDGGKEAIRCDCEHVLGTLLADELADTTYSGPGTATSIQDVLDEQLTGNWVLGTCAYDEGYLYEWDRGKTLWACLQDIVGRLQSGYLWTYDTSAYPWTLNLTELSPSANPTAYIDYSRNLRAIEKETDLTGLVTRLYPHGAGAGTEQIGISGVNPSGQDYIDSGTGTYGVIVHHWTDQNYTTAQQLYDAAVLYLADISVPKVTYRLSLAHLAAITGESIDDLTIGAMLRVTDEDLDIEDDVRIVSISKSDVTGSPGDAQIELGNKTPEFDLRTYVQSNDLSAIDISNIPGGSLGGLPATPTDAGLYWSTDYGGYHNGTSWATYMDNAGRLYASDGTYHFDFNPGAGSLSIKVSALDISATTGIVDTLQLADAAVENAKIASMAVDKLTSGTLDAQYILIANGGYIASGKTSYSDTNAGFWLGQGGVNALFNIGDATNYIKWTGTGMLLGGTITADLDFAANMNLGEYNLFNVGTLYSGANGSSAALFNFVQWIGAAGSEIFLGTNATIDSAGTLEITSVGDLTITSGASGSLFFDYNLSPNPLEIISWQTSGYDYSAGGMHVKIGSIDRYIHFKSTT